MRKPSGSNKRPTHRINSGTNRPRNAGVGKVSHPRARDFLGKRWKPACGRICKFLIPSIIDTSRTDARFCIQEPQILTLGLGR